MEILQNVIAQGSHYSASLLPGSRGFRKIVVKNGKGLIYTVDHQGIPSAGQEVEQNNNLNLELNIRGRNAHFGKIPDAGNRFLCQCESL